MGSSQGTAHHACTHSHLRASCDLCTDLFLETGWVKPENLKDTRTKTGRTHNPGSNKTQNLGTVTLQHYLLHRPPPAFTNTTLCFVYCVLTSLFVSSQADPIRALVTGAAGQIAYSLLYGIAKGDVFGKDQVNAGLSLHFKILYDF